MLTDERMRQIFFVLYLGTPSTPCYLDLVVATDTFSAEHDKRLERIANGTDIGVAELKQFAIQWPAYREVLRK